MRADRAIWSSAAATRIDPVIPHTIARSLAIGNPADGRFAASAIQRTGGWAAAVSDDALVAGIRLLAETTGVFAETAGGITAGRRPRARRGGTASGQTTRWFSALPATGSRPSKRFEGTLPEAPLIAPRIRELEALHGRDL